MSLEIGLIIAVGSFAIGYFTFTRNRDKDVRNDATESAVVRTKLDSIGQGVESIRVDMKVSERQMAGIAERVTRVEESAKQAHKRLDKLDGDDT